MPTFTFSNGDDSYVVSEPDTYFLDFLDGQDSLVINAGGFTTAHMGPGNDFARFRIGDGLVYGDAGNDVFEIGSNAVEAHGGDDADVFNLRTGGGHRLFGDAGNDRFNFANAISNVGVRGGIGDDNFSGQGFVISGIIYGDAGNDLFDGFSNAAGAVSLRGGAGNDTYRYFAGTSAVFAEAIGEGTDAVHIGRGVNFTLPANIENLIVAFSFGPDSAALEGNALNNNILARQNMDNLWGFDGNDRLYGGGDQDHLYGGTGIDLLDGGAGDDYMYGGDGNDTMVGRTGYDWMEGGAGNDLYYVDGATFGDPVVENAGGGIDTVRIALTQAGSSYTLADNVENMVVVATVDLQLYGNTLDNVIIGGATNDNLVGDFGNDTIRGGDGNDGIFLSEDDDYGSGGNGNDVIFGGDGNDTIVGGNGDDEMWGGEGNDIIQGGAGGEYMGGNSGVNVFIYTLVSDSTLANPDEIISESEFDTLDLSAIDANTTVAGNQAFTIVAAPTNAPGQLWGVLKGGGIDILGDVNGDGVADFKIVMFNWGSLITDRVVE